jgi:hypothetical protein
MQARERVALAYAPAAGTPSLEALADAIDTL